MKKLAAFIAAVLAVTTFSGTVAAAANTYTGKNYVHAAQNKNKTIYNGIDVSRYNTTINWKQVKADGISFAFIRGGFRGSGQSGTLNPDPMFEKHYKNALAAGMDIGVYMYSQATTVAEAVAEADYILSIISGRALTLPVVMDYEFASTGSGIGGRLLDAALSKDEATQVCRAFCERIEQFGYTAALYANYFMLTQKLNAAAIAADYPIWLAHYTNKTDYKGDFEYWQYTSVGKVGGIMGNVDCNYRYVTAPAALRGAVSSSDAANSITLSWNRIPGVYGYQIFKLDETVGKHLKIAETVGASSTVYTDRALDAGKGCKYKIRAIKRAAGKVFAGKEADITAAVMPTAVGKARVEYTETQLAVLKWSRAANADGYRVYRYSDAEKCYDAIAELDSKTVRYTDHSFEAGKTLKYMVVAYRMFEGQVFFGEFSDELVADTSFKLLSAELVNKDAIKLSWSVDSRASGYEIFKKTGGGKFARIKTVGGSQLDYIDSGLTSGGLYTYRVRAFTGDSDAVRTYFGYSNERGAYTLGKSVLTIGRKTRALALKWSKVSGADGYVLYMSGSMDGKYKKIATVDAAATSFTKDGLKSGARYYFKLRAYKDSGDKRIFGAYCGRKWRKTI